MLSEIHENEIALVQNTLKQYYDCECEEVFNSIVRSTYLAAIDNNLNHITLGALSEAFERTTQYKSSEDQPYNLALYAVTNLGRVNKNLLRVESKLSRSIGFDISTEVNKFYNSVILRSKNMANELLGELNLSIRENVDSSLESEIVSNYQGSKLYPIGSLHLTEICSPSFTKHRVEDKGYSVIETLINPLTSHALILQADLAHKSFVDDYSDFIEMNITALEKTNAELEQELINKNNQYINQLMK